MLNQSTNLHVLHPDLIWFSSQLLFSRIFRFASHATLSTDYTIMHSYSILFCWSLLYGST